jgi:ribosome modulation factor
MSQTTNSNRDPNASRDWIRQIMTQARRVDEENGALRNLYKRAKAAGENIAEIRHAIRLSRLPHEEAIQITRDQVYYMALRNIPVTQASLFEGFDVELSDATRRADDVWDAQEKGYKAGRTGVRAEECPYIPGSELYAEWHSGWRAGQNAIARELGPDTKMADASRKRPRRAAEAPAMLPYETPQEDEAPAMEAPRKRAQRKAAAKRKVRKDKGMRRGRRNGPTTAEDGVAVY